MKKLTTEELYKLFQKIKNESRHTGLSGEEAIKRLEEELQSFEFIK